MRATTSRIRARILNYLNWPRQNRHFVQTVSDVSFAREGWFSYGHYFMADEAGWLDPSAHTEKCEAASSQRIRRALLEYERAEIQTTYRLFEWQRGGGKSKAPTKYGRNFLNEAAVWIQTQLFQISEPIPSLVKIDELVPASIQFIPRKESRKLRSVSQRRRRLRSESSPPTTPQRNTQPTFHARNEMTKSALHVVRTLGVRVIPSFTIVNGQCNCKEGEACARPGKHPRIKAWLQNATRREEVVCDWFSNRFVPANIAILTGERLPEGGFLTVVDVDRRNFGFGTLAALSEGGFDFEKTFTVSTGDGLQYYYSSPFKISNTKLGRGIDIQGVGGYVLGPSSTHASGKLYSVTTDVTIATLPVTLQDILGASNGVAPLIIPEGERHNRLRARSYAMALNGKDIDSILRELRRMLERCELGSSRKIQDEELQSLARSAVIKVEKTAAMLSKIVA